MSDNNKKVGCTIPSFLYLCFDLCTAMVGHTIHGGWFWCVMDFIFSPVAWFKWLIFHEVNVSILRETFGWFLK